MGKKSRLKRERRMQMPEVLKHLEASRRQLNNETEEKMSAASKALYEFFSQYDLADVVLALGVSDLWLPNISSQVKHNFAFGIAISVRQEAYSELKRVKDYPGFVEFSENLYRLLPGVNMLEDFVPELDWGDVRIAIDGSYPAIFYGCNVERIPDFIEAFFLLRADQHEARRDMVLAVALQNYVISRVDRKIALTTNQEIPPGHIEIPPEEFWSACSDALREAGGAIQPEAGGLTEGLILDSENFTPPKNWGEFGDAVMEGTALPGIFAKINGRLIPISLRNATTVVIDFWAAREKYEVSSESDVFISGIARYLHLRFGEGAVVSGPLQLVSRGVRITKQFLSVFKTGKKFYFLLALAPHELPGFEKIEREIRRILEMNVEWALGLNRGNQFLQFRKADGTSPKASDIEVLVVLSRVATSWISLDVSEIQARILSLPDLISIFDSLKEPDEFEKFWNYIDGYGSILGAMSGVADQFASFRDSHALLVDGAFEPTVISLDPHWGSNWRFKDLRSFWNDAPSEFPDNELTWNVEASSNHLQRLIAKGKPALAWSSLVGSCTVQIVLDASIELLDLHNGRILELFVHCVADSLVQRRSLLQQFEFFSKKHIVIYCEGNKEALASEQDDLNSKEKEILPLLSEWLLRDHPDARSISIDVEVNLARVQARMDSPVDASFEVECLHEIITGVAGLLGEKVHAKKFIELQETAARLPRFTLKRIQRTVDVPDFVQPEIPLPEQYKVARRDLAIVLKKQGVSAPARYELASAKKIIDPARDEMRQKVHERIAKIDRKSLLLFCIEQHDALTAQYQKEVFRIKQSMSHEVEFDRSAAMASAHGRFTSNARNYRYLLECCLSSSTLGNDPMLPAAVVQIIASVDWLLVLYGASDVLHNDIDVAGLEVDHSFVPEVFYSHDREEKERIFSIEIARAKLGINLLEEDEVNSTKDDVGEWGVLNHAFELDLNFKLTHLIQALLILARWNDVGGDSELRLCYQARPEVVVKKLRESIAELSESEANRLIKFLTLVPSEIKRLLGKSVDEADVPVWEHNKRGSRYTIRPIIEVGENLLAWGAAAADRASSIWSGAITNGYLPADFNWPHVKEQVRLVKEGIESQLENKAVEICLRATTYVLGGVDFKRRFSKENFDDVGDFDVLAYWPSTNRWLVIECKYNQPPFCLKDARRLRERIFGREKDRGQFSKIEGRRIFLRKNLDQIRTLVGWPAATYEALSFSELYVSRDIYWWMRNPPYEVPTQFVRIDALDGWFREWLSELP